MPTAAWCSECNAYVWVSTEGGCVNGHRRSCLRGLHEVTLPASSQMVDTSLPAEAWESPAGLSSSVSHEWVLKHGPLLGLIRPRYDETTVFHLSISLILLFFLDGSFRNGPLGHLGRFPYSSWLVLPLTLVLTLLFISITTSVFHATTDTHKTDNDKSLLLFFALLINGLTGVAAGWHLAKDSSGLLLVFPVWSIVSAGWLVCWASWRATSNPSMWRDLVRVVMADDESTLEEVLVGVATVVCTFLICRFVFDFYWAITLSICVSYANNADRFAPRILAFARSRRSE